MGIDLQSALELTAHIGCARACIQSLRNLGSSVTGKMDAGVVFKSKAIEFAEKLRSLFPAQLCLVIPALQKMDDDVLLRRYKDEVHARYGERIKQRDDGFFLTTSDLDDPMNVVGILRGLWGELETQDKQIVWQYMDVFERLARVASK